MRKQINLTVVHEDVPRLLQTSVVAAVSRNEIKRKEVFGEIGAAIESQDRAKVAEFLRDLIYADMALREEVNLMLPLLQALGDDSVSSNTQVVKDLSDLQEDSLGVDGGSK